MVDGADELRFGVAQNELDMLLEHDDIRSRSLPVLFFANKSDKENCASE